MLVAGATGELGRALIAELLSRGHAVRALTRDVDAPRARALAAAGAELAVGDVLDPACGAAAAGCDAVVHAATAIGDWQRNDRLRREGTRNLLAGAERARASFLLPSSVLLYGEGGDEWQEAADPVLDPAPHLRSMLDAELATFSSGARFLILRQGILFGPESGAARALLDAVTVGEMPADPAWAPLLHPEDFAQLAAAALERDLNGMYDAVSDNVRTAELVRAAAQALGAPAPPPGDASGPQPLAHLWRISRRVSMRAPAKIGLEPRRGWPSMLEEALAARAGG